MDKEENPTVEIHVVVSSGSNVKKKEYEKKGWDKN